jgi:hypothetical protein
LVRCNATRGVHRIDGAHRIDAGQYKSFDYQLCSLNDRTDCGNFSIPNLGFVVKVVDMGHAHISVRKKLP